MKKETLLKKFEQHIDKIQQELDEIATLLEVDSDDDSLSEMSVQFRDLIDYAITENDECNFEMIVEYIRENL